MDGTVDGRISNRSRDQVLEHYLAIIATVCMTPWNKTNRWI